MNAGPKKETRDYESGAAPRSRFEGLRFIGVLFVAIALIAGSLGYMIGGVGPSEYGTYVEPGAMVTTADYIIFIDGSNYKAKNGTTGAIDFVGTNARSVIQSAIDVHNSDGGPCHIYVTRGMYVMDATSLKYLGEEELLDGRLTFTGDGPYATIFDCTSNTGYFMEPGTHTHEMWGPHLSEFGIQDGVSGILLMDVWNPVLTNIEMYSGTAWGLVMDGGTYGCSGLIATNVYVRYYTEAGVIFGVSEPTGFCSINKFYGGGFTASTTGHGIVLASDFGSDDGVGITTTLFFGVQIEWNKWGARLGDSSINVTKTEFISCWWDSSVTYDIMNLANAFDTRIWGGSIHSALVLQTNAIDWHSVSGYVAENYGLASITGAVSYVTVEHELSTTPTIVIATGNDTGIGNVSITYTSTTQFTITFANQPGASTWGFYWYARV